MIAPATSPPPAPAADEPASQSYDELVLSTVITHRFLRAGTTVHHFLLAGDPDTMPVLVVGGRPDSWWSWHARIEALAARHYVIAPVLLLDDSLRAAQIVQVLDDLGVGNLHVVADEHGGALVGQLEAVDGFRPRIISNVSLGSGALAHLQDPDLTNQAIIEWLALREQTMGAESVSEPLNRTTEAASPTAVVKGNAHEGRRAGAHVLEGA